MKPPLLGQHAMHPLGVAALLLMFGASPAAFARDPLRQPFHQDSIWNRPIGSEAVYVPAEIQKATAHGMTVDEDLIVLTPDAPLLEIYRNDAGWNRNRSRGTIDGPLLFRAPIPPDFIVSPDTWDGLTPNSGLAVLMPDGRTIKQTQPFARCTPDYGTSRYVFGDEDLYGPGYYGAHGGSGLSCIGGTLRVGELVPGAGPIRHALKVNLYAARNLYFDQETRGYRWPARKADGYAPRTYGTKGTPVKACRMGALLALPPALTDEVLGLKTEPARRLAQAFRDYGAYVVDDTAWDVYALVTEWGPAGRVTEEFNRVWGFELNPRSRDNAWSRDMDRILTNLHVVDNNGPERIGGGGQPRVPLAAPLARAGASAERIQPWAKNPYYWQHKGEPVLLLGGSDDDNLFQWERDKLAAHLDLLVSAGGNYLRNAMSDRDEGNVYAFARVEDRYDLTRWNEEYWRRFGTFLRLAAERDVIVQIELWDMWDLTRDNWDRHPFNPRNNVNYTAAESGLLTEVPFAPAEEPTKHNFFHTVPGLETNVRVLRRQEAFIDRVLELSLPFPNVLYCINNESGEPPQWSRYWAQQIHQRAKERGVVAQVTDMRRREDITHATHRTVYDDTDVYTFADVSQNTGNQIRDRRLQYRRLLEVRKYLGEAPRPINNVKIYNDNFGGAPKFMRNIFAGLASTRFHRPVPWNGGTRGLGLSDEAQRILRSVRSFTDALDWFAMQPRPDLLSHDDGVYLMAQPGRQYALGFDGGGSVELDARALSGPAQLQWMGMHEGKWIDGGRIEPGRIPLKTPGDGLWMALIRPAL